MLKYLYKFFTSKINDIDICFSVRDINTDIIDVNINYRNNNLKTSEFLARLIFYINKGFLLKNIVESMNNSKDKEFIQNISNKLEAFYNIDYYHNDPIIKPTSTFIKNVK